MAQYFDDCTALTNWSELGGISGTDFDIVSDGSRNVLRGTGASTGREIARLTLINSDANRNNIEILARQQRPGAVNATYRETLILRGAGTSVDDLTGYVALWASGNIRISRYNGNGTVTAIASASRSQASGTYYWFRFRANGTSLRLRVWTDGDSEPGSWNIDTTDSTYNTAGFAGPMTFAVNDGVIWTADFGVGTNGDTAPASPVSGAPTLSDLQAVNIGATSVQFTYDYAF